jgi:hypothetical protein
VTEAADKDSSAGGFLGSFLSAQKATTQDRLKAITKEKAEYWNNAYY